MGLAKFRSDYGNAMPDGSIQWFTKWMGGPTLAKIENCRCDSLQGDMRANVYIQGEPDTYFSQPAKCYLFGKVVKGYVTGDEDGNLVFHHVYHV